MHKVVFDIFCLVLVWYQDVFLSVCIRWLSCKRVWLCSLTLREFYSSILYLVWRSSTLPCCVNLKLCNEMLAELQDFTKGWCTWNGAWPLPQHLSLSPPLPIPSPSPSPCSAPLHLHLCVKPLRLGTQEKWFCFWTKRMDTQLHTANIHFPLYVGSHVKH